MGRLRSPELLCGNGASVVKVKIHCGGHMGDDFMLTGTGEAVVGEFKSNTRGAVLCEDMVTKASPSLAEVVSLFRELPEREADGLLELWVLCAVVSGGECFIEPEGPRRPSGLNVRYVSGEVNKKERGEWVIG